MAIYKLKCSNIFCYMKKNQEKHNLTFTFGDFNILFVILSYFI